MPKKKTFNFESETSQILHLLTHSIYSNKDVFLRELVSNASDAIDKARLNSLKYPNYLWDNKDFQIKIQYDSENWTITISDNWIWMTEKEIHSNIWTIAKSWTKDFLEKLKDKKDSNMIWQFWVWFYSVFMVALEVTLETKSNESEKGYKWKSSWHWNYELEESNKTTRGTEIFIKLSEENKEYADRTKLAEIIRKYSNYVRIPIMLNKLDDKWNKTDEFEQINEMKSIWTKNPKEVTEEEYQSFYQSLSFDFTKPLAQLHMDLEGMISYKALLYIPQNVSMFRQNDQEYWLKLYVQNVLILDSCKELIPAWLRFVSWVVETNDLPLNISREILQNNRIITKIRYWIISKLIDKLKYIKNNQFEDYELFFKNYWPVIKEWIHYDFENKDKIAEIVLFYSTINSKNIWLDDYISSAKSDKKEIYYLSWKSRGELLSSPYLDKFIDNWHDVLLLTDPIDEFVVQWLNSYKEFKFVSITNTELDIDDNWESKEQINKKSEENKSFLEFIKSKLWEDKIEDVKFTNKLKWSISALATKEWWISPYMEKIMNAMWQQVPPTKRIFELNPDSSLVKRMIDLYNSDSNSSILNDLVKYSYWQSILSEWWEIENIKEFLDYTNKFAEKYSD